MRVCGKMRGPPQNEIRPFKCNPALSYDMETVPCATSHVTDTKRLAPRAWYQAPGTWDLEPSKRYQAPVPRSNTGLAASPTAGTPWMYANEVGG